MWHLHARKFTITVKLSYTFVVKAMDFILICFARDPHSFCRKYSVYRKSTKEPMATVLAKRTRAFYYCTLYAVYVMWCAMHIEYTAHTHTRARTHIGWCISTGAISICFMNAFMNNNHLSMCFTGTNTRKIIAIFIFALA